MKKKKHTIIIVAGGTGKRMQENLPKQFLEINNKAEGIKYRKGGFTTDLCQLVKNQALESLN